MALDSRLWNSGLRGRATAIWRLERLQVKTKDLLKAKFWTWAAHQGLHKSLLADMTAYSANLLLPAPNYYLLPLSGNYFIHLPAFTPFKDPYLHSARVGMGDVAKWESPFFWLN